MDKSKLHHYWVKYRTPTLFIPLIGLAISGALFIYGMRSNNITMLQLKEAVIVADQQNGDIEGALQELRAYVTTHMNTNMRSDNSTEPPIQLVNQFNRYIEQEQARIASQGDANKVYQEAQASCETGAIPLTARAQCIQEYVTANGGNNVSELVLPPKELYTFDFASPRWAPDLPGITMIISIIFGVLLATRLVAGKIITAKLK
jgi:hypothetical protein